MRKTLMRISFVVAMDQHRLIGKENKLPWHLPADLKHFKKLTVGKSIIMGRKTFESIGKPLPERKNIIVTQNKNYQVKNACVVYSLKEAFAEVSEEQEAIIIGGVQLFTEAWSRVSRIYLTQIHHTFSGDTYFPNFDKTEWQEVSREDHQADEKNRYDYSFIILEKKA